jgi:hypothetical protein
MPHTNPWNVTDPPGSEQAKNIDNHIRKLRVDIGDRAADIVVDVMADPWKLKADAQDPVVGKQRLISFADFKTTTIGKEAVYTAGRLYAFTDTDGLYADVDIPVGCTITKIEVCADVGDANDITWTCYNRAFAAGGARPASVTAQNSLATLVTAGAGVKLMASGVLAITIAAGFVYYLAIEASGPAGNSFDLYGARITYDSPNAGTTR